VTLPGKPRVRPRGVADSALVRKLLRFAAGSRLALHARGARPRGSAAL